MPLISKEQLQKLEKKTENIRNICIIAHVDHGKTTLSDSLLATNGIISNKVAGRIRYLDSRDDEQERGITMKSSAVALYFKLISNITAKDGSMETKENEYMIHLIDSPGHVDFSSEVSVASQLCDGALVLIDVVEGICTQTHAVLRQAWNEGVKPLLVLNKIDRLIVELKLTPIDAYNYLARIVEQANAVMASFQIEKQVLEQNRQYEASKTSSELKHQEFTLSEREYFNPIDGSVIFASAYDGWAFRLSDFLGLYKNKLQVSEQALLNGLWGSHVYDSKKKEIVKAKDQKNTKNLFSMLILDNIWAVYDAVQIDSNPEKIERITKLLNVKMSPYELRSKDLKSTLKTVMSQWLPLSRAALLSVVNLLPNPIQAQKSRFDQYIQSMELSKFPKNTIDLLNETRKCCFSSETVVFVAKMLSIPRNQLSKSAEDDGLSENVLLGFARVFSGTLKPGQKIYALGPRYDPRRPTEHVQEVTITRLYFLMGRSFEQVDSVSAGNVVGIGGLDHAILKWGTLSSTLSCCSLGLYDSQKSNAVVRVAIEPADPTKMPQLTEGLRLLNQADPSVDVLIQETGEHVLLTSGELHLERCVRDLKEQFAKINIHVSAPIVPFRETISDALIKDDDDVAEISINNNSCTLKVKCKRLSDKLSSFLLLNVERMKKCIDDDDKVKARDFLNELKEYQEFDVEKVWAFGPKRIGNNILLNEIPGFERQPWILEDKMRSGESVISKLETGILSGFQLATSAGPLCAEQLHGIMFIVQNITFENKDEDISSLSGQMISGMKEACKQAMSKWSPRLMLAMYTCEIQATSEVLGKVYAVISKRRGKIIAEEMKEGAEIFTIKAIMPVVESFGFSDDIRKKTSGAAQPQLLFSGWEMLNEDPFWTPTTAEELEDLGEKADRENLAKKYMDAVRKRKGMFVEQKLVEHAEKQRTLKIK